MSDQIFDKAEALRAIRRQNYHPRKAHKKSWKEFRNYEAQVMIRQGQRREKGKK